MTGDDMAVRRLTPEESAAEQAAYEDAMERIARDDIDWGIYLPAWEHERPTYPWWRRLLKL